MQLMLAFVLRHNTLAAIPKAGSTFHVEENAAALDTHVSSDDWARIDSVFWPPTSKMHLDME
jgi:diketogulonate reductase-like aldo/keto reductase